MLSKLIRRTHMYLALFLTPWIAGYAGSTLLMNHGISGGQPEYRLERTLPYAPRFAPDATPRHMAEQILADVELDGTYGVGQPAADGTLVITRTELVRPRRLTYTPSSGILTIERAALNPIALVNRFHRRRGYDPPYAADRAMAISVDVVIGALVFWVLSGLWMWWEMRATRRWGLVCAVIGIMLFATLVVTI